MIYWTGIIRWSYTILMELIGFDWPDPQAVGSDQIWSRYPNPLWVGVAYYGALDPHFPPATCSQVSTLSLTPQKKKVSTLSFCSCCHICFHLTEGRYLQGNGEWELTNSSSLTLFFWIFQAKDCIIHAAVSIASLLHRWSPTRYWFKHQNYKNVFK